MATGSLAVARAVPVGTIVVNICWPWKCSIYLFVPRILAELSSQYLALLIFIFREPLIGV
jgi:hypothetical protein